MEEEVGRRGGLTKVEQRSESMSERVRAYAKSWNYLVVSENNVQTVLAKAKDCEEEYKTKWQQGVGAGMR